MYRRFNKSDLEKNLNQFFANRNCFESDSHRNYDATSWDISNGRNNIPYEQQTNYSSFTKDNREPQIIRNQEYNGYSYGENNHPESNYFNSQSLGNKYFNNQSLRGYGSIDTNSPSNYNLNDLQFRNNEMYSLNSGGQRQNYTSYNNDGNFQQAKDYFPIQESRFIQCYKELNGSSNGYQEFQHYQENFNRRKSEESNQDFRDNKMFPEKFKRFDREYNDDFEKCESHPRKTDRNTNEVGHNNSWDRKQIEKLDDGFVCIKNPEYFPEIQKTEIDNSRKSIGERRVTENRKYTPRHSRDLYQEINKRTKRNLSSNSDEVVNSRIEENLNYQNQRNTFHNKQIYQRNTSTNRYEEKYYSDRKKYNEYQREKEFLYEGGKSSNTKRTSNKRDKNAITKRVSFAKSSLKVKEASRKIPESATNKIKLPVDAPSRKESNRNNNKINKEIKNNSIVEKVTSKRTQSISISDGRKQQKPVRTKLNLADMRNKKKKFLMYKHRIALKAKEKKKELKEAGTLGVPSIGRIKYNPEKYWKDWWSVYYYIEDIILKVDPNDKLVRNFIKFRYDINDPDLDNHVRQVYENGIEMLKKISNINEINYERRIDTFKMLKYKKMMENKDFQSYTLPRESKMLNGILENLNNQKVKLALLYQSVIHRWHTTKRLLNAEDKGSPEQLKYAEYMQNSKLFHYLVFDAIQELKKLTSLDWPEFNEFYNSLRS